MSSVGTLASGTKSSIGLLDGQQLAFAFRRTSGNRPEPAEALVDRVAATLAFYP